MSDSKKKYYEMRTDSIVEDVKYIYDQRSEKGQRDYGTTLEDNPDDFYVWLNHLQEEFDGCGIIYPED